MESIQTIHGYWANPDAGNQPDDYTEGESRSEFLLNEVKEYLRTSDFIFEPGCNIGRNLNCFYKNGFTHLFGADINHAAVCSMGKHYPDLKIVSMIGKLEDVLPIIETDAFDVVYTMAVLEHIHPDSEFLFDHLVRIAKRLLVTVEDERGVSWRHFPRDYHAVFNKMNMVKSVVCENVEGLHDGFRLRVFSKKGVT